MGHFSIGTKGFSWHNTCPEWWCVQAGNNSNNHLQPRVQTASWLPRGSLKQQAKHKLGSSCVLITWDSDKWRERRGTKGWCLNGFACVCFFWSLSFISWSSVLTLSGMGHCGFRESWACVCACMCMCVYVYVWGTVAHVPLCSPAPVWVQTDRQTDEGKTESHVIYRFTWSFTVLFSGTHSTCPHQVLTPMTICQP